MQDPLTPRRVATTASTGGPWGAPVEATVAVLELVASKQPELLEFQAHVLCNSTMSFAVQKLAAAFDVPIEKVGGAVSRACGELDRLEKQRGTRRDPATSPQKAKGASPDSPNLAALLRVCQARLKRVSSVGRRRRLEKIRRRVQAAYELARTRAWIGAFIGPPRVEDR